MRISFKFYFIFLLIFLFSIIAFTLLLKSIGCIPDPTYHGFKKVKKFSRNVLLLACRTQTKSNDFTTNRDFSLSACDASKSNKFTSLCHLVYKDGNFGEMYYVMPIVTTVSADYIFAFIGIDETIYKLNINKLNDIEKLNYVDFKISIAYDLIMFKASEEKIYAVYYNRKLQKSIYCVWDFKNKQLTKREDYSINDNIVYEKASHLQYLITNHGLELMPNRIKSSDLGYIDYKKDCGWLFSENPIHSQDVSLDNKIMYSNGNGEKTIAIGNNAVWGNGNNVFFIKNNQDLCFINIDNKSTKTLFRKKTQLEFLLSNYYK